MYINYFNSHVQQKSFKFNWKSKFSNFENKFAFWAWTRMFEEHLIDPLFNLLMVARFVHSYPIL